MRRIAVAIAVFAVLGCIPKQVIRRPSVWDVQADRRAAFLERAVTTLQNEGFVVDAPNEATGTVKAELAARGINCGMITCTATDRLVLVLNKNGQARLDIMRTIHHAENSHPASYAPEVENVEEEEARLMSLITGDKVTSPVGASDSE